jgi:colanic acid/amylovoran biosynthesis glycosyltransferase
MHSHFCDRGWGDVPLARRHRLAHVVTFYGYDVNMLVRQNPAWRKRYAEMFRHIDLVLCEGPFMRQKIVELGCPDDRARVQRLGVEVDKIRFAPRRLDGDEIKILTGGAFREKKGIPYALEAVGRLVERGEKLRVTLFGDAGPQPREQEEKRRILEVIRRYRLDNIVTLRGFQPYSVLLEEAYSHHIFLSPSVTSSDGDTEGGAPVALIDMAATGMPIVSSLHCDIPQVVLDGIVPCF